MFALPSPKPATAAISEIQLAVGAAWTVRMTMGRAERAYVTLLTKQQSNFQLFSSTLATLFSLLGAWKALFMLLERPLTTLFRRACCCQAGGGSSQEDAAISGRGDIEAREEKSKRGVASNSNSMFKKSQRSDAEGVELTTSNVGARTVRTMTSDTGETMALPSPAIAAPEVANKHNLPGGWQSLCDENGTEYYHNTVTNETSWTRPHSTSQQIPFETGTAPKSSETRLSGF